MGNYINDIQNRLAALYPKEECRPMTRMILEDTTQIPFHKLIAYKDNQLNEQQKQRIEQILSLIEHGTPIQYALGRTYFLNLPLQIAPGALIPRPETEELVHNILETTNEAPRNILDIGTGSGCIAIALKHFRPKWNVWAIDISDEALSIARNNAIENSTPISFLKQDIKTNPDIPSIPPLDLIVSNPPYVMDKERSEMERHVLEYEPEIALFVPDNDPLIYYRAITIFATKKLKTKGMLAFEINAALGKETCQLIERYGFQNCSLKQDIYGRDRFVFAKKP